MRYEQNSVDHWLEDNIRLIVRAAKPHLMHTGIPILCNGHGLEGFS